MSNQRQGLDVCKYTWLQSAQALRMALHVWYFPSLSLQWKFKDVEDSTSDGEVFRIISLQYWFRVV